MNLGLQNESIWERTAEPRESFPAVSGYVVVDVAIVGGGISGLTAASLLSEAGLKVAVIEARSIGLGTTGRSTGNLYATVGQHLSKIRKAWGDEDARRVVDSRADAMTLIERLVRDHAIDCNYRRVPFYQIAESTAKVRMIEREYEAALKLGLRASLLDEPPTPFRGHRTLRIEDQAQFHPLRYARGLARVLKGRVGIFEHSPAIRIDAKEGRVTCPGGEVHAKRIINATHSPKGTHRVHLMMSPMREHGVAARIADDVVPDGIFWSYGESKHSTRTLRMPGEIWLLTIGDSYKTGHCSDPIGALHDVHRYMRERFPVEDGGVTWGAQSYKGADSLPYIGKMSRNMYMMTGFAADGLVYGTLGAMIVSDQILGKPNVWEDLYSSRRITPLKSAHELLKESVDNVSQYLRDLPKVGTIDPDEIRPGEGRVVERRGEKIAVYRDEDRRLHCVSAVCTHMKCIVKFNPAEKSWDCPCHASRFQVSGEVIEGPALRNLQPMELEEPAFRPKNFEWKKLLQKRPRRPSFSIEGEDLP